MLGRISVGGRHLRAHGAGRAGVVPSAYDSIHLRRCRPSCNPICCPLLTGDDEHGSWFFALQITDRRGRRQRMRRGGFRTADEAAAAREEIAEQDPALSRDDGLSVGAWLNAWADTLPRRVRASMAASYTAHVTNILIPALGHLRLGALTRDHVQAMFDELVDRQNRHRVPITANTLQRIRATLCRALNVAIARGLIVENPARLLDLPSPRRHRPVTWSGPRVMAWRHDGTRPPIAVWTPRQLATFLTAVASDDIFALWWLAGLRGMRRGELLGLRWTDLDLADATLTVRQALVEVHGTVIEVETKTPAGNRTITLDPTTVAVLAAHRRRQRRTFGRHGIPFDERGYVFTWQDGRPLRPDWVTHRFTSLAAAHGMPPVRLHDLRHGTAMNALNGQASIHTVQHLLGHSSHAFTADTYGTVPDALARAEANATAEIVAAELRQAVAVVANAHRVDVRRRRWLHRLRA